MAIKFWTGATDTDYSVSGNWSPSGVPIAGDDVYITDNARDIVSGLDQSAIVLDSFHVSESYIGVIGTDSAYLEIASPIIEIGEKIAGITGSGSSRLRIDAGSSTASAINVLDTGSVSAGLPALDLIAVNASTDLNIINGVISLGGDLSAVTVGTVNIHGGTFSFSDSVTMTKLNQSGGAIECRSNLPDLDQSGGTLKLLDGATAITTAKLTGTAQLDLETSGALTVTTVEVVSGVLNALLMTAVTITNLKVAPSAQVNLDLRFTTLTNDISLLSNQSSKRFKILF